MQTTAVVIPAAHTIELRQVALKPLGPGDVLVRTTLTSISAGTERMLLKGVMPHPMLQFPVVPGYETVGCVIDAGADAREWVGKRVYVGGNYGFEGVNPAFGGQSAHIIAPTTHLTGLDTLTDSQGVMLALTATALHGVDMACGTQSDDRRLTTDDRQPTAVCRPQSSVVVLGQGVVGQLAARFAKARGAHVTVVDKVAARLNLSVADVAHEALPAAAPGVPPEFDVVIDATGKMDAIAPLLMRVKRGGAVVLLGYYDAVSLPYQPIFLRELRLLASAQWAPGDLVRARDAIAAGEIDVRPLITHRMPAGHAPEAFDVSFNDPACVKMLLEWTS
jgi:3-hydroxyethyl bacteriochlorophyllide a dehydrogenase